jgi:aminopeptidase
MLVSRKPLRNIMDKREDEGVYSWTLCLYPTEELARQARATIEEYTGQVKRACYLDFDDPVAEWQAIYRRASEIKRWLNGLRVRTLHVESASCDLRLTPGEQRRWVGISGHNIPSFEIFLSPDWRGTEGVYYANLPSYRTGNYVENVRLTFERGKAVGVEAGAAQDFVLKQVAMDPGASRVGEFSLTDRRFSRIDRFMADTLFDENFGGPFGNCHLAVGSSYAGTYSGNAAELTREAKRRLGFNDSALHWDLINTEDKTVTAHLTNGRRVVIYEKGIFTH